MYKRQVFTIRYESNGTTFRKMLLFINKRAMLTLGGPSHTIASTLDVILEEFFKAERSDSNEPSLEEELNKDYAENFLKTYELIPGDPREPGSKRFSVEPLWKNPATMPPYDLERGPKEAFRRFLALERKINLVKNSKLKDGYHSLMEKHIANRMLEEFGSFDDLKEDFYDSVFDPSKKEEFLALDPTHLVIQPSKQNHKIRTTVDYSNLNVLFFRGKNMLPPIHEKVAGLRCHTIGLNSIFCC